MIGWKRAALKFVTCVMGNGKIVLHYPKRVDYTALVQFYDMPYASCLNAPPQLLPWPAVQP